jgi:signal transduction histidine kinase
MTVQSANISHQLIFNLREQLAQSSNDLPIRGQIQIACAMLAAHELRNPLSSLLDNAQVLRNEASGHAHQYAEIIVAQALALKDIIDSATLPPQFGAGELVQGDAISSAPISQFSGKLAAQDLANPLANLLGYAQILEDEATGCPRQYAEIVVSRARQLKGIVDSVTLLQRLDAGELDLKPTMLSATEILQSAIDDRQHEINERHLAVEVHREPNLIVQADRLYIGLVVSNLLANAIKFSSQKQAISIGGHAEKNSVIFTVHDDGIGIPPENHQRIFHRFFQVSNCVNRGNGGLGLGLSVAKAIVELHHGRIWVESAQDQGSTFSFSLRRAFRNDTDAYLHQQISS